MLVLTFGSEIWIKRTRTKQEAKTKNADKKLLGEFTQTRSIKGSEIRERLNIFNLNSTIIKSRSQ
jgi:hypothetical protein